MAAVVYIDPELNVRVRGNPGLASSPIANFEVRSELFWGSGDNMTVSLFYKDIDSPIEQIRSAGSDDDIVLGFANAESGEISGIEVEGLKGLPAGFFLTGNMTLSDSEISLDPNLSTVLTNLTRRMTGHSEWVINSTLGYDSNNGRHSAYLNFNAFGERIYFAGTGRNQDAYERRSIRSAWCTSSSRPKTSKSRPSWTTFSTRTGYSSRSTAPANRPGSSARRWARA